MQAAVEWRRSGSGEERVERGMRHRQDHEGR